jgi:hypothetical protein
LAMIQMIQMIRKVEASLLACARDPDVAGGGRENVGDVST